MSEKRQPWLKFYTADWRGDAGLRAVGFAARGLWMDMLSLMHEAEPYGHLVVNGTPLDAARLAARVGGTAREVQALLEKLEAECVFSRTDDGAIYSRRMIRDHDKAERDRKNGKGGGGNPELERGTVPKEERVRGFKRSDAPGKTERVFARSNGRCHWCGTTLDRETPGPNFFHVDHVVPVRDGGTNDESNLVAACAACNHARARKGWRGGQSDPNPSGTSDPNSDPNPQGGSDRKAQIPDTRYQNTEASLLAPSPPDPPPDARSALWSEGLPRLRRLTGKPDGAARAILGRLCRDARDDCALVATLLHEAERDRPMDPMAWIAAALKQRTGQIGASGNQQSKLGWMLQ